MAKKVSNSINEQMFYALKVSENSGIPALFMSNPGVGKSTTVEIFAKLRGYSLLTLRGNSTTADEIYGYDTVPAGLKKGDHCAAIGLRPSWFQQLMETHEAGGKTLLFLDEITTASESVQNALLFVIFERSCKQEKLPEDTLIVAAGNYAQNLGASATLIPPVMNRFMIFNLIPKAADLRLFLNRYDGASVNKDHMPDDKNAELRKLLKDMDNQELVIPKDKYNRVGEFIAKIIRETATRLEEVEKKVDWGITDLNTIYSDETVDGKLYGFPTPRTYGYLLEWAFATYRCFGSAGIKSDNFLNAVNGLCGIGLSRRSDSSSEVKVNYIGRDLFQAVSACIQEIEKMNNTALPEYEQFFANILDNVDSKGGFKKEEIVAFTSKIRDMQKDESLKNIERPIPEDSIKKFCSIITTTGTNLRNKLKSVKTGSEADLDASITPEAFGGHIETWNSISDLVNVVSEVISSAKYAYKPKEKTDLSNVIESLSVQILMKIRSVKKLMTAYKPGVVLPDLHDLKKFTV